MANSVAYKDITLRIGDTIAVNYRIKEGEKERQQLFSGILVKARGSKESKVITVRKISRSGIGVERVIPLNSPFVESIKIEKESQNSKSKIYYIRNLSGQQLRMKLYHKKVVKVVPAKITPAKVTTAKKKTVKK